MLPVGDVAKPSRVITGCYLIGTKRYFQRAFGRGLGSKERDVVAHLSRVQKTFSSGRVYSSLTKGVFSKPQAIRPQFGTIGPNKDREIAFNSGARQARPVVVIEVRRCWLWPIPMACRSRGPLPNLIFAPPIETPYRHAQVYDRLEAGVQLMSPGKSTGLLTDRNDISKAVASHRGSVLQMGSTYGDRKAPVDNGWLDSQASPSLSVSSE